MKAKDTSFLVWRAADGKPARMEIRHIDDMPAFGKPDGCKYTLGAMYTRWRNLPASELKECLLWMALEMADGYGVPIKDVMREMEKIDEFIEHWNAVGNRAQALF